MGSLYFKSYSIDNFLDFYKRTLKSGPRPEYTLPIDGVTNYIF